MPGVLNIEEEVDRVLFTMEQVRETGRPYLQEEIDLEFFLALWHGADDEDVAEILFQVSKVLPEGVIFVERFMQRIKPLTDLWANELWGDPRLTRYCRLGIQSTKNK